jgi:lipooligosaccharide transport system permease protein
MKLPFLPPLSRRLLAVWERNFKVYKKTWKVSFLPPFIEPFLFIVAFGLGLSAIVKDLTYQGIQISYIDFIIPALLGTTIMHHAFFETSFASFVRMRYQKSFDAMMATPLNLAEIITGEIFWAATKSIIAATLMIVGLGLLGLIDNLSIILVPVLALLGGFAFGATGMFFTSIVPNIETFNLPMFLFITPMFLFSGTFFPLETLPPWAQGIALALPLTHLVRLTRAATLGIYHLSLFGSLAYLLLYSFFFYPLALKKMQKRLIK